MVFLHLVSQSDRVLECCPLLLPFVSAAEDREDMFKGGGKYSGKNNNWSRWISCPRAGCSSWIWENKATVQKCCAKCGAEWTQSSEALVPWDKMDRRQNHKPPPPPPLPGQVDVIRAALEQGKMDPTLASAIQALLPEGQGDKGKQDPAEDCLQKLSRDELQARQSKAGGHLRAKELEYKQQVAKVQRLESDLGVAKSAALATLQQMQEAMAQYHKCLAVLATMEMCEPAGPKPKLQQKEQIDTAGLENDPQVSELLNKLEEQRVSLVAQEAELRKMVQEKKQKQEEPAGKKQKLEGEPENKDDPMQNAAEVLEVPPPAGGGAAGAAGSADVLSEDKMREKLDRDVREHAKELEAAKSSG